jgi:hypothetical protein
MSEKEDRRYVYCIDSSSIFELKDYYKPERFQVVWRDIETLIEEGRLVSPMEVYYEIKDPELAEWKKSKKGQLFIEIDEEQAEIVKEIQDKFPDLVNPDKPETDADPFVVGLAVSLKKRREKSFLPIVIIVITEEKRRANRQIPDVCDFYGIDCIKMTDLFDVEDWSYE